MRSSVIILNTFELKSELGKDTFEFTYSHLQHMNCKQKYTDIRIDAPSTEPKVVQTGTQFRCSIRLSG